MEQNSAMLGTSVIIRSTVIIVALTELNLKCLSLSARKSLCSPKYVFFSVCKGYSIYRSKKVNGFSVSKTEIYAESMNNSFFTISGQYHSRQIYVRDDSVQRNCAFRDNDIRGNEIRD